MVTRQELYDRIRASSKDEVVLEEMIRLGFWPKDTGGPGDPAEEIRRRGELERQLRSLLTEQVRLQNPEAITKAWRQQRMEESRRRQQENKERRLRERQERAAAWRQRKQREILYLGDKVSGGLNQQEGDDARLIAMGLPVFKTAAGLAAAMQISVGELRFLAYSRRVSTVSHYQRFQIPKKTGGLRLISAPMPRLKRAQEWVLRQILEKVPLHDAAHGFRRGRSIVSNATPHVGADVVVNLDLQDFFPTITYRRVRGVFRKLGYSEQVATLLALLCSEPDVDTVELDGRTYHVARGERFLPQGAPTSPAITNLLCRRLDSRLHRIAERLGFRYSRYADDLTFSASGEAVANVGRVLRRVRYVVEQEDLRVHPKKTRILRRGRRQEVTGLVVNQRVNVSRDVLRRFRATLFQIERDGPAGKRWGNSPDVLSAIEGFANFVAMVDAAKGRVLLERVRAILRKHGPGRESRPRDSR
jgi:retron-type reverse transcriptase